MDCRVSRTEDEKVLTLIGKGLVLVFKFLVRGLLRNILREENEEFVFIRGVTLFNISSKAASK